MPAILSDVSGFRMSNHSYHYWVTAFLSSVVLADWSRSFHFIWTLLICVMTHGQKYWRQLQQECIVSFQQWYCHIVPCFQAIHRLIIIASLDSDSVHDQKPPLFGEHTNMKLMDLSLYMLVYIIYCIHIYIYICILLFIYIYVYDIHSIYIYIQYIHIPLNGYSHQPRLCILRACFVGNLLSMQSIIIYACH